MPPIRFMKNSSCSIPMIPANLTRSSRGVRGSATNASTRRANESQESSRLMNASGPIAALLFVTVTMRGLSTSLHPDGRGTAAPPGRATLGG